MKLSQLFLFAGVAWVYIYGRIVIRRLGLRHWEVGLALGFAALLLIEGLAAHFKLIQDFQRFPPPFAIFFFFIWAFPIGLGLSCFGREIANRASFQWLIGFHVFRILAELVIHFGYLEGFAPQQLSFHGYNFDIITGLTAMALALRPKLAQNTRLVWLWNLTGIAALLNIAFIAITSMPTPLRLFMSEPDNRWVTYFPYIFLPGILVVAAVFGHVLVTRKLLKR